MEEVSHPWHLPPRSQRLQESGGTAYRSKHILDRSIGHSPEEGRARQEGVEKGSIDQPSPCSSEKEIGKLATIFGVPTFPFPRKQTRSRHDGTSCGHQERGRDTGCRRLQERSEGALLPPEQPLGQPPRSRASGAEPHPDGEPTEIDAIFSQGKAG